MAQREELEIEIGPDGAVRVRVEGIPGGGCLETLALFQSVLGPVTEQQLTEEYYQGEQREHARGRLHRGPAR